MSWIQCHPHFLLGCGTFLSYRTSHQHQPSHHASHLSDSICSLVLEKYHARMVPSSLINSWGRPTNRFGMITIPTQMSCGARTRRCHTDFGPFVVSVSGTLFILHSVCLIPYSFDNIQNRGVRFWHWNFRKIKKNCFFCRKTTNLPQKHFLIQSHSVGEIAT